MINDVVVGFEDPVREPVELPDVFLWVQLRAFGERRDQGDIGRGRQGAGEMPASLIEQERCVRAGRELGRDLGQVKVHGLGVTSGHDERRVLALLGTERAEDIGRDGSLVLWCARASSPPRPAPGDLVLLADARLVGEPDLYGIALNVCLATTTRNSSHTHWQRSTIRQRTTP